MPTKTRVLFGDNESNWGNLCASMLDSAKYEVTVTERDALSILEKIHSFHPHIIILETYMSMITSIGFMEMVKYMPGYDPKFIVVNSHGNIPAKKLTLEHGASVYLVKPFGFDQLCDHIETLTEQAPAVTSPQPPISSLAQIVSATLLELKVSASLKGYQYLRAAIIFSIDDFSIMESVTKNLYPAIAKMFETNILSVERAIRNAIASSWEKLDRDTIDRYLGGVDKKPTNARYIATVAECIRLKNRLVYKEHA